MFRLPYRFLYIVVFISGALAILYETIWFRRLSLVLGSTSLALTLILTTFMLGLGLGGYFFGKLADRWNPKKLYQILEAGIGIFGLLSFFIVSPVNLLYKALSQNLITYPALLVAVKFLLTLFFLLGPTLFMGGTMPVAVRYLVLDKKVKGKEISNFYWINTLGAAGMAVAMPLFFMAKMRMSFLLLLGACGNFLLAIFVFFLPERILQIEKTKSAETAQTSSLSRLSLFAFFLSGAASLALETLWNRHFIIVFGGSIYTFGFILGVYLLGIVAGSVLYTLIRRDEDHALRIYTWSLLVAALYIMISLFFLPNIAYYHLAILSRLNLSFSTYHLANMILLLIFIFPITLCFGMAFPAAIHGLTRKIKVLGKDTGVLYFINSLGTALGPFLMTFLILPSFNFKGSYYIVIFLLLLSAIFMMMASFRSFSFIMGGCVLGIIILPLFHPSIDLAKFLMGTAKSPQAVVKHFKASGGGFTLNPEEILYAKNDIEANVVVAHYTDGTNSLIINGKNDASDGIDMYTQSLSGHIPFLTNRKIRNALVIGLGSGVTSHAVLTHEVKKVNSVEISPAVIEAAKIQFKHVNRLCFTDPRSAVIAADGRNYLTYNDEKYDLIISEPSNPWLTGVSSLFTKEFFEIVRSKLTPGGILCQWTNLYNLNVERVFSIFKTVELSFPYIVTFLIPESSDMLLIASDQPLSFNAIGVESFPKEAKEQLASLGITSSEQIYHRFMWNSKAMFQEKPNLPPNSDLYPWLELLAPKDRFFTHLEENILKAITINQESHFTMYETNNLISRMDSLLTGKKREWGAISLTMQPFGRVKRYYRFTGYFYKTKKEAIYIKFHTPKDKIQDLAYLAHQFCSDPFAKGVDINKPKGYRLMCQDENQIITSAQCGHDDRVYIYIEKIDSQEPLQKPPIELEDICP